MLDSSMCHGFTADLSHAEIEFYLAGGSLSFSWFMASDGFLGCGGAATTQSLFSYSVCIRSTARPHLFLSFFVLRLSQ